MRDIHHFGFGADQTRQHILMKFVVARAQDHIHGEKRQIEEYQISKQKSSEQAPVLRLAWQEFAIFLVIIEGEQSEEN